MSQVDVERTRLFVWDREIETDLGAQENDNDYVGTERRGVYERLRDPRIQRDVKMMLQ